MSRYALHRRSCTLFGGLNRHAGRCQPGGIGRTKLFGRAGHFTLTAELVDFQAMRIRLFRGPDPICEIHAADVEGQLAVASTDVRVPEACTTFLAQHDDFEAPLVNESFDRF